MSEAPKDADATSVEEQIRRLEAIVDQLAGDGIELDTALQLFEEGVSRLRAVTARLSEAETRVKTLVEESDGSFALDDFDE